MTVPMVAVVGRPNVGKSTLFNRLAGERIAIVEDVPGTTRDRVYADISWGDREISIVDTGGLEPKPESSLRQEVQKQAEVAIREADAVIFMVDVLDGVTLPDLEVAETIRRSHKPVILAANKADNEERRQQAFQFHELGIGEPIAVSAFHGTGISDLMEAVMAVLPPRTPVLEKPGMVKIAILGRPNVGKSMLLNAIIGQERAVVSEAPGTTRDALDTVFTYRGEPVLFIDTAGIRRRGRIEAGIERYSVMRSLRAIARADVVLLVTEAGDLFTAQDAHIAGYVKDAYRGLVVVVNKWDLAGEKALEPEESAEQIRTSLRFFPGTPVLFVSALLKQGTRRVLPAALKIAHEREKRIATAQLNQTINRILSSRPPPSLRGRQLKVSYVTQAEAAPPTFIFFVNDPTLVHFSYQRYLENQLREAFGFGGIPIKIVFKRKGRE
ncbi:MAG: ribosome biogenesis GTPase Der [Dehalococcoidia bacterium]|nr:ribosome biogenesis GTPase Der [Dehalococcoidia bacterium]